MSHENSIPDYHLVRGGTDGLVTRAADVVALLRPIIGGRVEVC
jgi:hypothetical protein